MLASFFDTSPTPPSLNVQDSPAVKSAATHEASEEEDAEKDEADVGELLYDAQMDMISHRLPEAVEKLERAVEKGSSAACATLANLLTRASELAPSPPSATPLALPSILSDSSPPVLPPRQSSCSSARTMGLIRDTTTALRATELFVRGLEIELRKPLPNGRKAQVESGYGSASEGEDDGEGRFFSVERTVDLVVGVTESHRFSVIVRPDHHADLALRQSTHLSGDTVNVTDTDPNDCLWSRSFSVAKALLSHPTIAHLDASCSSSSTSSSSSAIGRPSPRRRPSSISRSYTHAASALPSLPNTLATTDGSPSPAHLTHAAKLQLTIAIHARYILALHAPTSSLSSAVPSSSTFQSSASAEAHWSSILRLAAPYAAEGGIGIKEADELVQRAQHRLDTLRRADLGAEEPWRLAKHGKRRGRPSVSPTETLSFADRESRAEKPTGMVAISGGEAEQQLSSSFSTVVGSFGRRSARGGGSAPKFHIAESEEEGEGNEEEEVAVGQSGCSPDGTAGLMVSIPFTTSASAHLRSPATRLADGQLYPSPPDTPPLVAAELQVAQTVSRPPALATVICSSFTQSPTSTGPSTAPNSPFPSSSVASPFSASSHYLPRLPRYPSTQSVTSYRTTGATSILSSFSHNPLQTYLSSRPNRGIHRPESLTSICITPPDFENEASRRWSRMDKGKMRALDVESVREMVPQSAPPAPTKSWLSRFWSISSSSSNGDAAVDAQDRTPMASPVSPPISPISQAGVEDSRESLTRSMSSSAVDALRATLDRHEEARRELVSYWGESEFLEVEEEEAEAEAEVDEDEHATEEEQEAALSSSPPSSPPPHTRGASELTIRPSPTQLANNPCASPPISTTTYLCPPSLPRRNSQSGLSTNSSAPPSPAKSTRSKRSFLLSDPTSSPSSSSSRKTSTDRRSRREARHQRNISATSSTSTLPSRTALRDEDEARPAADAGMDPLLLELERRSGVGVKTVCAACGIKGFNFPVCTTCKGTYCKRECRVTARHGCSKPPQEAASAST